MRLQPRPKQLLNCFAGPAPVVWRVAVIPIRVSRFHGGECIVRRLDFNVRIEAVNRINPSGLLQLVTKILEWSSTLSFPFL